MAESELLQLAGIGPKAAKTLEDCGYNTIEKIAIATADELSELPGIGKATAEKFIQSAKEMKPTTKPVIKPAVKKPTAEKESLKKTIPKPKTVKSAIEPAVKPSEPLPSVKKPVAKPAVKKPVAKPAVKKPVAKPAVKKPVAKPAVKKPVAKKKVVSAKPKISKAAKRAIESAPAMRIIKPKRAGKKTKTVKKEKVSQTYGYGIVNSVLHDRTGRSSNRSVVVKIYDTEIPLTKYLGRKVIVHYPNSTKQLTGVVAKLHGKKTSLDKTVIVRFKRSVSPHIITAKAIFA